MATVLEKQQHLYKPVMAQVAHIETLTGLEKRFEIALPDNHILGHKPGQFVEISVFGFGEAPISLSSSPTQVPTFDLTIRKTGRLTEKIHSFTPGMPIGIRGPYGNGFDLDRFYGKDVLFVCGGIGLAPLKSLIDFTIAKRSSFGRLIILYGTKSPQETLFREDIEHWKKMQDIDFLMTVDRPDDTWKGNVGVITTLIPSLNLDTPNTMVAVVGPPVMYKYVLMALKSKRIHDENIYMSLERRMKCGVGKCGHCQINDTYVCQDGPVYHYPRVKLLREAI